MRRFALYLVVMFLLSFVVFVRSQAGTPSDGIPVFKITPVESKIKFHVDASTTIEGAPR